MVVLDLLSVAGTAAALGPLTHTLLWKRYDLDSSSHYLLIVANLIFFCSPTALWLGGLSLLQSFQFAFVAEASYIVSLLVSIGIYRAFLHPLNLYPGPFWAKISVFWRVKQFANSNYQSYRVYDDLHRKYGTFVRVGPRQLSINELEAYQKLYGPGTECRRDVHLEHLRRNIQSLSDFHEHKARRNVWDHGLNAKACQSYLPRLNEITIRLCDRFAKFGGRPVLVNDWCHFYTSDVMGELGFGRSYGQLESGVAHPAILKVQAFLKAGVTALQMIWFVNFLQLIPVLEDPIKDLSDWAQQTLDERAETRSSEKKDESDRDLMSYVEESRRVVDSRWPMSDQEIAEDAVTLQVAGSDTSYSVLVNLCHYLANYPELQDKIRKEVLNTFSEGKDVESGPLWSKLASPQSCPYLDATINEVLRIHAPVLQGLLRESPNHAIEVAGRVLPPNTLVSCPIWTLQTDERFFKDADQFIPQRWLETSHPDSQSPLVLDKRGFVPFSIGPMNCAGKYFAYMEIKVFVAHILRQFRLEFPSKGPEMQDIEGRQSRDKKLVAGMRDYLTQWASDVEVCFYPLTA